MSKSQAIKAWQVFQQLPVDREFVIDIPDPPKRYLYVGPMHAQTYHCSKWSRRGGIHADLSREEDIIPSNLHVNYIHTWKKNLLHVLKHPRMNYYYFDGTCKVLNVGIDDSGFPNPKPNLRGYKHNIPKNLAQIGQLVNIYILDKKGDRCSCLSCLKKPISERPMVKIIRLSETYLATDGDGEGRRLFMLKGKVKTRNVFRGNPTKDEKAVYKKKILSMRGKYTSFECIKTKKKAEDIAKEFHERNLKTEIIYNPYIKAWDLYIEKHSRSKRRNPRRKQIGWKKPTDWKIVKKSGRKIVIQSPKSQVEIEIYGYSKGKNRWEITVQGRIGIPELYDRIFIFQRSEVRTKAGAVGIANQIKRALRYNKRKKIYYRLDFSKGW